MVIEEDNRKAREKLKFAREIYDMARLSAPKFLVPPQSIFKMVSSEEELYQLVSLLYGKEAGELVRKWIERGTFAKPLCQEGRVWKECSYRSLRNLIEQELAEWRPKLEKFLKEKGDEISPLAKEVIKEVMEKKKVGEGELRRVLRLTGSVGAKKSLVYAIVPLALMSLIDKGKIKGEGVEQFRTFAERYYKDILERMYFPDIIREVLGISSLESDGNKNPTAGKNEG